jgi:diaminopimelate epimerase
MRIEFHKYQGTGNDFILADNRNGFYSGLNTQQIRHLCDRRFGIGADGFMLLNTHETLDFEMKYYNSDGNESTMCGNGGRCIVQFAKDLGVIGNECIFSAIDGKHEAKIMNGNWIELGMKEVGQVGQFNGNPVLDTGSPHVVVMSDDADQLDVFSLGKKIRDDSAFSPNGINVNFVKRTGENAIFVRTFERGVEDETLSCGTGVTASALSYINHEVGHHSVSVETPGGSLTVGFLKTPNDGFKNIVLCGPATRVFKGEIEL